MHPTVFPIAESGQVGFTKIPVLFTFRILHVWEDWLGVFQLFYDLKHVNTHMFTYMKEKMNIEHHFYIIEN